MRTCSTCGARAPLCNECVDAAVDQFRGVAACRGQLWGEGVRARGVVTGPWPAWTDARAGNVRAIARRKVADLASGDEQLLEVLARVCGEAAAAAYTSPEQRPGGVAFTVGVKRGTGVP